MKATRRSVFGWLAASPAAVAAALREYRDRYERKRQLRKLERMIANLTPTAETDVSELDRWIVLMRAYARAKGLKG